MNKFFLLLCLCLVALLPVSQAQVTDAHVWVNEFRYDNLSSFRVDDQDDFVELIVSNEILNSAEAANYQLVLYTANGFDMDTENGLPGKGLPYSKTSILYTAAETFHSLADEDALGINGFQRCPVATGNYTVLTKKMTLMDIPTAFGIIYDDGTNGGVVQLISYERAFKIKNHADAGPAAGQNTTLMPSTSLLGPNPGGSVEQNALTDGSHSIQLRGTGAAYGDFGWDDNQDPIQNFNSPCMVNSGQTINELPCIAPAINNPGNQTACNSYTLPAITGQFLSDNAAYFDDSQANGGTEITGPITSNMTVWIFDDNGCNTAEESFDVTLESGVTIPDFSDVAVCSGDNTTIEFTGTVPAQSTLRWQMFDGTNFVDIPNESMPTLTLNNVTMTGTYRLVIDTDTGCSGTSNEFMVVANSFEAGTYNGDQTITEGDNATPFAVITPAAGDALTFQWQSSLANNNFDFSDIAGANMETYDPGAPTQTTFYRRITTNTVVGSSCPTTGDDVTVDVQQQAALAVTLTNIEAFAQGNNNLVAWKTAVEQNTKGFHVEWSTDGKNFLPLGFVNANNQPSSYTFVHENPVVGENYYRLQELDQAGKKTASSIVNVLRSDLAAANFTLAPNPAQETVVLNLPTTIDAAQDYEVTIYNTNGQIVATRTLAATATLAVNELASGLYQVTVQQGEQRFETQLVKVK